MEVLIPSFMALFGDSLLSIAATLPRIAAAFVVLPLLTNDVMPSLVRNSLYVSLTVMLFPLSATQLQVDFQDTVWPLLIVKEIFIGLAIGLVFGGIFWALTIAGGIVDTQAGTNMANIVDPIQGHQSSLTGAWLSRLAAVLFMVSGAFLVFLEVLLTSYAVWPVSVFFPSLSRVGTVFFADQFGFMMTQALLIATPVLIALLLIDFGMGVINRFAQNMNVLPIVTPIKSLCATAILMIMLGMITESVIRQLGELSALPVLLSKVFGAG